MLDRLFQYTESYQKLHAEVDRLLMENERLRLEINLLRDENRHLRSRLHQARLQLTLLYEAYADAICLMGWALHGYSISRESCKAVGMSERKWARARALLIFANVHDGYKLTVTDVGRLQERVKDAYGYCKTEGLAPLRVHMARKGR